jgi:hypothetical protein
MEQHVKILATLNIILSLLGIVGAVVILAVFGGLSSMVSMSTVENPDARIAAPVVGIIGGIIGLFVLAISIPGLVAGLGLLQFKEWARILGIVISALNLLQIPFGTALGVYGLWVLLSNETAQLFRRPPQQCVPGVPGAPVVR